MRPPVDPPTPHRPDAYPLTDPDEVRVARRILEAKACTAILIAALADDDEALELAADWVALLEE